MKKKNIDEDCVIKTESVSLIEDMLFLTLTHSI